MIRGDHANCGARICILDGTVAEVGVDFDIAEVTGDLPVLNENRPERERIGNTLCQQLGRRDLLLVIRLHCTVLEQRHRIPYRFIAVHRTVADNHPVIAEAIIVTVNRKNRIVAGSNLRGNLRDIGTEAVVGKSGLQAARILQHNIRHIISNRV
ncbi:hypothetical protein D3C73_1245310 [compost metagenome]